MTFFYFEVEVNLIASGGVSKVQDLDTLKEIGVNVNNGLADILDKLVKLPSDKAAEIEADIENMRSAWHWAIEHEDLEGLEKGMNALGWFFESCR